MFFVCWIPKKLDNFVKTQNYWDRGRSVANMRITSEISIN
jgi:hypothetical protein